MTNFWRHVPDLNRHVRVRSGAAIDKACPIIKGGLTRFLHDNSSYPPWQPGPNGRDTGRVAALSDEQLSKETVLLASCGGPPY